MKDKTCIECGSKNIDMRNESSGLLCSSCESDFRSNHLCTDDPDCNLACDNCSRFEDIGDTQ